ncbi:hypothetical protein C8F04DRAFT_657564 [Mycena alexandri]|uniref:Uncharacterized protein n=1 Tax=Mycena alexandri TaxID=1745969 RepID=A0AAD6SQS2_9AGAR|nr:hypothetical protein C8F04DRAFT_657564 [Mycena alexandri]
MSILTWNDWRPRSNSYPPRKAARTSSQARFPESAASFDAAKALRVRAAAGTLLGRHLRLCPRTSTSARSPGAPHPRLHTRANTAPPAHLFIPERRLTHLRLVSYTHTTSRSHLLSVPSRPRPGSAVLLRPAFPSEDDPLASLGSEWNPWDQWEGAESAQLSASLDLRLSTSHAGNPSSSATTHIAAETLGVLGVQFLVICLGKAEHPNRPLVFAPISIHPCIRTAIPVLVLRALSAQMEMWTCAPTTTPKHFESLSLFASHRFPAPASSRALPGTCLFPTHPHPPGRMSRAPPWSSHAAPSTRVQLALKTATVRPALRGMAMGMGWRGRGASPTHTAHARAPSRGRTLSCVCPRTSYVRACSRCPRASPPLLPRDTRLAPSRPPRARASFSPASRSRDVFVSDARRARV